MPRWALIIGDGLVYEGRCLLLDVIVWPVSAADYAIIYDGRDATAGKKFGKFGAASSTTRQVRLTPGVPFDIGIYVDAKDSEVETTVVFEPLPE